VGFRVSWVGFKRIDKNSALEKVGLRDTGDPDEVNEAPFSGAEIPGGWFILFSNDFLFVSRERLSKLSTDCSVVACQVHEGIMVSIAYGYEHGNRVWEVAHNAQRSWDDLSIFGAPPVPLQSIQQRHMQNRNTFDIPIEVAAVVCNELRVFVPRSRRKSPVGPTRGRPGSFRVLWNFQFVRAVGGLADRAPQAAGGMRASGGTAESRAMRGGRRWLWAAMCVEQQAPGSRRAWRVAHAQERIDG